MRPPAHRADAHRRSTARAANPASLLGALLLAAVGGAASAGAAGEAGTPVVVASKKFTESVLLGEMARQVMLGAGVAAEHRPEIGGTRILFNALERGEIDVYPEYTGTIVQEILRDEAITGQNSLARALRARRIRMTEPLGFNNTYAIGMRPEKAAQLGIERISDLREHPDLRLGFTNEFLNRGDGWPSLRDRYGLPHQDVRGLDHDLAYRALAGGDIDVMDFYSTDAEIAYYGLKVIEDDRDHFPVYNALFLYGAELAEEAPQAVQALEQLAGTLSEQTIRRLNKRVKIDRESERRVAADFLAQTLQLETDIVERTLAERLWLRTREHLFLVGVALAAGILVAVPLGVLAFKCPRVATAVLGVVGVIQTIPALALLVFMIPLLGISAPPAIAALFLYSLLPMVRNTHAGLRTIPVPIEESAEALGLSAGGRLWQIELPLASPSIVAGIKTSAVITIGFATLGALIGAGGYGQPILTGIRLDDYGLILEGAVPAALLALVAQQLFDLAERWVVPKGLRLRRSS